MTDANDYFTPLAALLDPGAIMVLAGGFSETVPVGETWYALNMHWLCGWQPGEGVPFGPWEHRSIDHRRAVPLPAGTLLQSSSLEGATPGTAFALICRPALVASDPRYADAETLYYQRMNYIRTTPGKRVTALQPAGAAAGGVAAAMNFGDSTADFFAVRHMMNERNPWIDIVGTMENNTSWLGLNVMPEISDSNITSVDDPCICVLPRKRPGVRGFDTLWVNAINSPRPAYARMDWLPLPVGF